MRTINFKEFKVFTDITKQNTMNVDIRLPFADLIYKQAQGVEAHSLAFKIYNSDGAVEITGGEEKIIIAISRLCSPLIYDSINIQIED